MRGLIRRETRQLGNFWVDFTRSCTRVLLPLSLVAGVILVAAGVIDNWNSWLPATLADGTRTLIPGGPVAAWEPIKLISGDGGGFFNASSAHPFENPDGFTSALEIILMLIVPTAMLRTYGRMVGSVRAGYTLLAVAGTLFVLFAALTMLVQHRTADTATAAAGGAMNGVETRLGVNGSSLFGISSTSSASSVVSALRLAIDSCIGIDAALPANIVTKTIGWQAIDYEVSFFVSSDRSSDDTLNVFFDAAHRHLEALSLFNTPADNADASGERSVGRRLVDSIGIFGLLSREEKEHLASVLQVRELAPGDTLLQAGEVPSAITLIGYGVINASARIDGEIVDIMRFSPCEYFGESGPIAGVAVGAEISAKTYAIVYELPGAAIAALLKRHPELTHVLAAKLAERERRGQALMEPPKDIPPTPRGLAAWLARGMQALHGMHL